jgi:hypothetical protein
VIAVRLAAAAVLGVVLAYAAVPVLRLAFKEGKGREFGATETVFCEFLPPIPVGEMLAKRFPATMKVREIYYDPNRYQRGR